MIQAYKLEENYQGAEYQRAEKIILFDLLHSFRPDDFTRIIRKIIFMKKTKTTIKDIEVRTALLEHSFVDIRRRLDHIEVKIESLSTVINHGIGAWRAIMLTGSFIGAVVALVFK
jgi:hypothetical protein